MSRAWTCQRVTAGVRCRWVNPSIKRLCEQCGKPRPPRKRPTHRAALDLSYEEYVLLNGGDHCGICGRHRTPFERKLDRDHCHHSGRPRGLLCHRCNRALPSWVTEEWLRSAIAYLDKANRQVEREAAA